MDCWNLFTRISKVFSPMKVQELSNRAGIRLRFGNKLEMYLTCENLKAVYKDFLASLEMRALCVEKAPAAHKTSSI